MATKSFDEALNDLELLADVRSNLHASECTDFETLINREIAVMLRAPRDALLSKRSLQYLQRITTVRTKLSRCLSRHDTEGLNDLVMNLLSATKTASGQAIQSSREPTPTGDATWEVPVVRFESKFEASQETEYDSSPILSYKAGTESFYLKTDGEEAILDAKGFKAPLVALVWVGEKHGNVRLLPCVDDFNPQTEVFDITLKTTETTQILVNHLIDLGCVLIQCPSS
ncbi:MAG: hypothetical protein L6R39_003035 [Caloplaca ligustica]|nr:MAG: hypothetical protein L6R39_003035 [Caloplaca ligustica]